MSHLCWPRPAVLLFAALLLVASFASAQDASPIADTEIKALHDQLAEAQAATTSARTKLAIRRVIRSCEDLLAGKPAAPNRFEVLGVLYTSQQQQLALDDSTANRQAFLETCRALLQAPDDYVGLRLDADLLLTQAQLAQQGADAQTRADALKPLVQRYLGTGAQTKAVRIAMVMALELGDASLIGHLTDVIAENFPGDPELINFQRDKLGGQVFGAPFVGTFKRSDGKLMRLPMDGLGKTTALYFWSKEDGGIDELKDLVEGWGKVPAESDAQGRYQFISFNLDQLPDAGESILRELGLDWPALHLPGGREHPVYKTYASSDPKLLTMTPTGYMAIIMSGATRAGKGWERSFQSGLARNWSDARYANQIQFLLAGDFLVIDPTGGFDPAAPPEWKAVVAADSQQNPKLNRTDRSVPADKLSAIQACFVKPPLRYQLPSAEVRANYAKAEQLCREAIASHADADDLWIVRNRLIVALMGRWKAEGKREHFDAALTEAHAAIAAHPPAGTDIIARFCIAREALRSDDTNGHTLIENFAKESPAATADALAALLAMEIGDRKLHEHYRRASLDQHAQTPVLWNITSFFTDRYHRYWMYHPPFTAGWTYGRRQGHFLAIGTPEDARRTVALELKTLEGESVRLPDDAKGKWTVILFGSGPQAAGHLNRYGTFISERPFDDVQMYTAVLSDDADAVKAYLAEQKTPNLFPTLLVPGGIDNPIVQQLGILEPDSKPNILILRPDGSVAAMLSGLTMGSQNGNAMQSVLEWHDEQAVDEALARGDLEEAKRLAFAFAPIEQLPPADAPKNWRPTPITVPHLRSRAKVYLAMGQLEAASADAQEVYLEVNSKAGHISMRTDELDEIEALKASILAAQAKTKTPE